MSDEWLEVNADDMMHQRAIPPEVIRDFLAIGELDDKTVAQILLQITGIQGFATRDTIAAKIRTCLPDANPEIADGIVRVLLSVDADEIEMILKGMDRWRKGVPQRSQVFSNELYDRFAKNLRMLIVNAPSMDVVRKGNALLRDVGNEFKSVAFFCDLRPVFDESRKRIEGFVNLANMRLLYLGQDNRRRACEIALTEDELKSILEEGQKALSKLEVLKTTTGQMSKKSPDVER